MPLSPVAAPRGRVCREPQRAARPRLQRGTNSEARTISPQRYRRFQSPAGTPVCVSPIAVSTTFVILTLPGRLAKLANMMGTSIGRNEDTYHRFLRGDEERYGSALDTFEVVI
jgi:hypothetical protein